MRARNIKPGFFLNEEIGELDTGCRLLFIGLWCLADREGFLKYRPKRISIEIFPYDQGFMPKVEPWLALVYQKGLIRFWYERPVLVTEVDENSQSKIPCYSEPLTPLPQRDHMNIANNSEPLTPVGDPVFIEIVNFTKHQKPHSREKDSEIKPLLSGCCQGHAKATPRRPECGKRKEERGMRNEDVTVQSSKEQSPGPHLEPVLTIPLNKKNTFFEIFPEDIREWQETFPGVDVFSSLRRARQWSIDYPKRRKTAVGIRGHLSTWLSKDQDKARGQPVAKKTARQENIDNISNVRKVVENGTGFNPYRGAEERDSGRDVDQDRLSLPE